MRIPLLSHDKERSAGRRAASRVARRRAADRPWTPVQARAAEGHVPQGEGEQSDESRERGATAAEGRARLETADQTFDEARRPPPRDSINRWSNRNQAWRDSAATICLATSRKSRPEMSGFGP